MKKTYLIPQVEVAEIKTQHLMGRNSIVDDEDFFFDDAATGTDGEYADSRRHNLWDED